MKKTRLAASFVILSVGLSGGIAVLNACSSDDDPVGTGGSDASPDRTTTNPDTGVDDSDTGTNDKDSGFTDAGILPDANCGDGSADPYCDLKITAAQSACLGIGTGNDKLDTGNRFCNNCMRKYCCAETVACIGNGKPPNDGGVATETACTDTDICMDGCRGAADAGGCISDCAAAQTPEIQKLHKDWANCWVANCQDYPDWYKSGGELCGCLMGSDAGPCQ